MNSFSAKRVWITGASSGIGEAVAYAFARQGACLILSSRREAELQRVRTRCLQAGSPDVAIVTVDLGKPETITAAASAVLANGGVDILFNNGGISQRSLTAETPIANDRQIMEVNYFGNIALTKAILPSMLARGNGRIVVNSSISGKFGFPLRSAYAASKHALHGFYESLQTELYGTGVGVTLIVPGRVVTNISYHALEKDGSAHGKMDPGQATGISAERCATLIVRAVQRGRREVLIGGKETLMVYIRKFCPPLFFWIARRVVPA